LQHVDASSKKLDNEFYANVPVTCRLRAKGKERQQDHTDNCSQSIPGIRPRTQPRHAKKRQVVLTSGHDASASRHDAAGRSACLSV
jgi:hypothetical protein